MVNKSSKAISPCQAQELNWHGPHDRSVSETAQKLTSWLSLSDDTPNGHLSAHMPPNEIYYDADFFREENRPGGVLRKFWTYVGHVSQFSSSTSEGKYITATLGHNLPILVTQAPDGSLRGFVNVTVGPGALDVAVPCNSAATLCSPRAAADAPTPLTTAAFALSIDGVEVAAVERAGHLCAAAPR